MASNGDSTKVGDTEASLDKIKRQLASSSGRSLLQGPLLKRSETLANDIVLMLLSSNGPFHNDPIANYWIELWLCQLSCMNISFSPARILLSASGKALQFLLHLPMHRQTLRSRNLREQLRKWNERWVILDPSTGKMEYKMRRNEPNVKGTIIFDATSSIALSPVNFHASQLVLKAHKEAVNSLSGSGSAQLGTVATVVAAANSTAQEATREIEAAMKITLRNTLGSSVFNKSLDGQMDDTAIMKETLRVKDEELQNLARELRSRDSTIMELAEKLSETAQAAEAAASAAHTMDDQRRVAFAEKEQLKQSFEKQLESAATKLRECEETAVELSKEKDQLAKQRDSAIQEAHLWRTELGKARDRVVILEAAVVRAEEKARNSEIDAEARIKEATQRETATLLEKEDLKIYVNALQAKVQRQQMETREVFEKTNSPSDMSDTRSLTKHVDSSDENVDKPCLSVSKSVSITEDVDLRISEGSQGIVHPTDDGQWNDIEATESTISDVREVSTDDRPT
ncbi:hypothetical protein KSS87_020970 [Heliosperma pusillum]|nr:hypothetical protein KSS87_020970 [Heliosperma pusillum]